MPNADKAVPVGDVAVLRTNPVGELCLGLLLCMGEGVNGDPVLLVSILCVLQLEPLARGMAVKVQAMN